MLKIKTNPRQGSFNQHSCPKEGYRENDICKQPPDKVEGFRERVKKAQGSRESILGFGPASKKKKYNRKKGGGGRDLSFQRQD